MVLTELKHKDGTTIEGIWGENFAVSTLWLSDAVYLLVTLTKKLRRR